jgi:hypothetical protein
MAGLPQRSCQRADTGRVGQLTDSRLAGGDASDSRTYRTPGTVRETAMTVQNNTPDIAADGVAGIDGRAGAPVLPSGRHQAVDRTALTCTWVTTDDGALVMRWSRQAPEDQCGQMTEAAA